jgi:hypothetical protein
VIELTEVVLADCVRSVAAAWVESWRAALRRDGRAMSGGWPGTIPEARALLVRSLTPELAKRGLSSPPADRLARASRDTYAAARRAWLAASIPEE